MPKATVKMQQTQPLIATAVPAMAPKAADRPMTAAVEEPAGTDALTVVLSIVALLASGAAAWMCYQAFTAVNGIQ
jgi:hypothetical protein